MCEVTSATSAGSPSLHGRSAMCLWPTWVSAVADTIRRLIDGARRITEPG
jgi:hypothetical protein